MELSRRAFTSGSLSIALGTQIAVPALAQNNEKYGAALAAIQAFGEADLAFNRLPGMTLGLATPAGGRFVLNFGYADPKLRTPITSTTLFQIGSITKLMVGAIIHQLAAEGRFELADRISDRLPGVPLPSGNNIQIQHVLDHVAGLPGDAPMFAPGGLWTGYAPGEHWHYSNTGYEILGRLAEHVGQKPLAQLLHERIFVPLRMSRSRGAIVGADRLLYAQGYEPADQVSPYVRGDSLAPAPWVDVTFGAGCVASTADDMLALTRALGGMAAGKPGLGLSTDNARKFTTHAVPSDVAGMRYGNGLMHVSEGGREYLHHTGGMLSFSSSFHVDVASGVSAFASAPLNAFIEYRPRLVTRFAADALTAALAGRPIPPTPALDPPISGPGSYVGRYSGPAGAFEIRLGSPLTIVAGDQSAPLAFAAGEVFRTSHPQFRTYSLMFERASGVVETASWGPNSYVREGSRASLPQSNHELALLSGRYINDDPWFGAAPVVERAGRLWIGTETPMHRVGDNLWSVGKEAWSPERGSFANFVDGRPQTFVFSAISFSRHDI